MQIHERTPTGGAVRKISPSTETTRAGWMVSISAQDGMFMFLANRQNSLSFRRQRFGRSR